jgi:hypothetical protein
LLVPINTSVQDVLRRWVEFAQHASDRYRKLISDHRIAAIDEPQGQLLG